MEAREVPGIPLSHSLSYSLQTGLFLIEPGARLTAVISRDPPVSVPHSAGVKGAFMTCTWCWGTQRSSLLHSKHSYMMSYPFSSHTWYNQIL